MSDRDRIGRSGQPTFRYIRHGLAELDAVTRLLRERLAERRDPDPDRPALIAFALQLTGHGSPTEPQATMLRVLDAAAAPMTVVELAQRMRRTRDAMLRTLVALEDRRWVTRDRAGRARLTATGRLVREVTNDDDRRHATSTADPAR